MVKNDVLTLRTVSGNIGATGQRKQLLVLR